MGKTSRLIDGDGGGVPEPESRPIFLRGYAEPLEGLEPKSRNWAAEPSDYVLVFDTETTIDASQRLRIGSYQVRAGGVLLEKGIFFDPDAIDLDELQAVYEETGATGGMVRTVRDFIEEVFFEIGYKADATIVGFNLPFDLSRIAINHDTARKVRRPNGTVDRTMVGGFTFRLSALNTRPFVRVKHLSRRSAFINFSIPSQNRESVDGAFDQFENSASRGFFLDLKTLASALTSYSFSLDRLASFLGAERKKPFKDFGRKIDRGYVAYAAQDAATTWACYEALIGRYDAHDLAAMPPTRIYSEASLGKAYLKAIGVKPWRQVQAGFSAETIGKIMSTYYGGRAEVHRRREIVRALYCDFASMYPSVCNLMGLWWFVIAEGVDEHDATAEARALLERIGVADLNKPEAWAELTIIVQVKPRADIFPVRARYGAEPASTIGVNYLSSEEPIWFTLADCIASKLLTGKAPEVISAIRFMPKKAQPGLRAVNIAGKPAYRVEPTAEDFYKRVIDLRRIVKGDLRDARKAGAPQIEVDRLDAEQLALKILANATSYGVFIELNVEDADADAEPIMVYGGDDAFQANPPKREIPGTYFHPLLATLITGAARLMLAITERLLIDAGLDWAFCDTDSMAFAMPDGIAADEFERRVREVCKWFEALNPYDGDDSLLEFEDQNYAREIGPDGKWRLDKMRLEPLHCLTVSAKRYALFNWGEDGEPVVRKASGHGLGHLLAPYAEPVSADDDADEVERESGVPLWQEDVWRAIIRSAASDRPRKVSFDWHESLRRPAASQHSATTPALLRGFKTFNADKAYPDRVRPFGFMLWFHAKRRLDRQIEDPDRQWEPRERELKPAAPYASDPADALENVFDRDTGESVSPDDLRSYAEVLRAYHLHPETKFLGGGSSQSGVLRRRHIMADPIHYIGKEADQLEEADEYGFRDELVTEYDPINADWSPQRAVIAATKISRLKAEAHLGHQTIAEVLDPASTPPGRLIVKLYRAALRIAERDRHAAERSDHLVNWAIGWTKEHSVPDLASILPYDADNLRKVLNHTAKPSARLLDRLEQAMGQEASG